MESDGDENINEEKAAVMTRITMKSTNVKQEEELQLDETIYSIELLHDVHTYK